MNLDLGEETKEPCFDGFYANHTICETSSSDESSS